MKPRRDSFKTVAAQAILATLALSGAVALMVTAPEPASAAKGGGGSKGGGGTVYGRVSFTSGAAFAIHNDTVASCASDYWYWLNLDGNQDPGCTASSGYMEVGFPGTDGLLLRTHATPTILGTNPGPNRYVEIEFRPLTQDDTCLDLDQNYDSTNPDFQGYVPIPDPDSCVDHVEATFTAGNQLFDPSLDRVECVDDNNCPKLIVDQPQWSQRRHKPAELTWAEHLGTIRFRSGLDVTHPDADTAVLSCSSPCEAELRQNGIVLGEYDMPFEVTFTRVTQ